MDRYTGPGEFTQADSATIDVHCTYTAEQNMVHAGDDLIEGLKSWRGSFTTDNPLIESGAATLALPDGRTGEILIGSVEIGMGTRNGIRGTFVGNGAPPT